MTTNQTNKNENISITTIFKSKDKPFNVVLIREKNDAGFNNFYSISLARETTNDLIVKVFKNLKKYNSFKNSDIIGIKSAFASDEVLSDLD